MTVSVAMIVRNEAHTLGRCLASVHTAVDEIVIVDTGSTDATKAVARRYTDVIYDFPWRDDFAAARQFAFDKATGDWVAWLDADDIVHGAAQIRPMTRRAPAEVGGFSWRYVAARDHQGNPCCEYWRERCVRNDGSFRWQGRVHEVLVSQHPHILERHSGVLVEHHSEAERGPEKLRRNLAILEQEEAACNGSPPARLLFYLGREYASSGQFEQALATFERYLKVATWDDERYLALRKVADLHRIQQGYDQAIDAELQALKVCPHWPDAYFGLAQTYYYLQDWHRVLHWSDIGRAMHRPETIHIINPLDYSFNWIIYYTNALYRVGALREAQAWTRRALEIHPDDEQHQANFRFFARLLGERQEEDTGERAQ